MQNPILGGINSFISRLNASRVGTCSNGRLDAKAIAFAAVIPILSPVNDPGPFETATISSSLVFSPFDFKRSFIIGTNFSE